MNSYGSIGDLVGAKLVRYKGSEWSKDLGIRAIGQSEYHIDESIKSLTIRLMNGRKLVLKRDEYLVYREGYCGEHREYLTDFTCKYKDKVIGRKVKFSLFVYLGDNYTEDDVAANDKYTGNYVKVLKVNPKKCIKSKDLKTGKSYKVVKVGEGTSIGFKKGDVVTITNEYEENEAEFWVIDSKDVNAKFLSKCNKIKFKEVNEDE